MAFLVPFFSLGSPLSFVGKATLFAPAWHLCFWRSGAETGDGPSLGPSGSCTLNTRKARVSSVLCLRYRILGGIHIYLMNFPYHLSVNRQQLYFLAAVNFAGKAIHKADDVHGMNCFSLPLHS